MTKFPNLSKEKTNILIVEDETLLALGMEYSLEEYGYCVSGIETTAKDAICHAKEYQPNVILMDIRLKGEQTGIDAAKAIWKELKIPVIFLTSHCDDHTMNEAMQSEPYAYLIKPCRDEELKVAIETSLKKHQYIYNNKNDCSKIIQCIDGFKYDKGCNVLFKEDEIINLTGKEILFFDILSDYPEQPITFERISDYIWDDEYNDIGKLRTLVYRIKNKVGKNLIENIFEHGYRLKSINAQT